VRLDFRSERRGYTLELSVDLFGAFILRRHWFGLSNRRGGGKQQVFMNESDALKEVRRIVRTRGKNGYREQ
jgi:predicted DNA-binding WGR domain protein